MSEARSNAEATSGTGLPQGWGQWQQTTSRMHAASGNIRWTREGLASIKPKDIGVMFGPMLTEEQFKALGKTRSNVLKTVVKE
jgi:hypothetical protein